MKTNNCFGHAPCKCGYYIPQVLLTGYYESDGGGGTNWEVNPGQFCPECKEPLNWLHQPADKDLILSVEQRAEIEI